MVPAFIYDTIKLSNRFVGPILRLKNSVRSVADGKPVSPLKFRGGDFWHELADDFNRLNEKLGGAVLTNAKDVAIDPQNSEKQTIVAPVNMQVESSNTFDNHTPNATH